MMQDSVHIPVMLAEVLCNLKAEQGGVFLDCTLGGGGHTRAILSANSVNKVQGCDRDQRAKERAMQWQETYADRVGITLAAFSELKLHFPQQKFSGILADLGISSDQLSEDRGFSFKDSTNLDMRMNTDQDLTAHAVVNSYDFNQLYRILKSGGVGKFGKAITAAIVKARPINSASELADCIHKVCGLKVAGPATKDSATVVFQAIRMEVNQEISELTALLEFVQDAILPGGRFVVIAFHSLEDAIVTKQLRTWSREAEFSALTPGSEYQSRNKKLGQLITKKALLPTTAEIKMNPRARSARMRVFEFSANI